MSERAFQEFQQAMIRRSSARLIELDCPPGSPRPGDLIAGILEGTGLPIRDPISKVFGNWSWDYSDIDAAVYEQVKPLIKQRIQSLHHRGLIRYGSW